MDAGGVFHNVFLLLGLKSSATSLVWIPNIVLSPNLCANICMYIVYLYINPLRNEPFFFVLLSWFPFSLLRPLQISRIRTDLLLARLADLLLKNQEERIRPVLLLWIFGPRTQEAEQTPTISDWEQQHRRPASSQRLKMAPPFPLLLFDPFLGGLIALTNWDLGVPCQAPGRG